MRKSLIVLCTLLLTAGSLQAEVVRLDPVVVTATRQAESIANIPAHVTILSSEEIEESAAENVPELLRSLSGVLVNDITGNGSKYTVDLRGFGETAALNTLVLIDGRRINQADLSGVDWTLTPKERIERIEIIHGGRGSVLYGDNASGGVINIITKKGTPALEATVGVSAGSYDTYNGYVSVSNKLKDLSFAINSKYQTSNGYRDNSETTNKDIGLNLGYEVSDHLTLRFSGGYHENESGLPGALTQSDLDGGISRTTSNNPDDYSDTKDKYLQAGAKFFFTDTSYFDADVSSRRRDTESFSSGGWGSFRGLTEIETLAFSPQLVLNEQIFNHATKLIFGYDYEKSTEDIKNSSVFFGTRSAATFDLRKESNGYFTHGDFFLTEHLAISTGYRKDRANYTFKAIDAGTSDKQHFEEDLYTAGVNYALLDNASLYASYAKSYRYPVLDEMFYYTTNTVDTQLKEQTADNFEMGFRYRHKSSLSLTMNLFRIVTNNEIFYNPAAFKNDNLDGDGIRQGAEITLSKQVYGIWLNGSYTYRRAKIEGGQYDGKELPNVPKHQATVGVQTYIGQHVNLNLQGTYVGKRHFISDFNNQLDKQDDYFLLSGKLAYLLEHGTAYLAVRNILDEKYEEYGVMHWSGQGSYYPSPGSTVLLGFDWSF